MRLIFTKRYNWKVFLKNYKFELTTLLLTFIGIIVLAILIQTIDAYFDELDKRISSEYEISLIMLDFEKMRRVGAPGYTHTDWLEGTTTDKILKGD